MDETGDKRFNAGGSIVAVPASRSVLLMTAWYPPDVGAAAERMAAFARHLPGLGWPCHVLCPARESPPDAVPGVTIHAVRDPLWRGGPCFPDYDPRPRPPRWAAAVRRWVFPDRFFLWRRAALRAARRIVAAERVRALLASFPPASAAQLGGLVRERTGLPLVLDFRDRWLDEGGYCPASERVRRRHARLEAWCVSRAAGVVAVSENMAQALRSEHGLPADRVLVLPNGYEPPAGPRRVAGRSSGRPLVVAHVGAVIPRNRPDALLRSLVELRRDPALHDVVFRFVGNLSAGYVESLGLAGLVQTTGWVPSATARREMQAADALLLLTGGYVGRWGHNAKLFEYIQTGRPILCLEQEPGSNDRRLLERFAADRAFCAALGDAAALAGALRGLRDYVAAHPQPALELDDAFREYSRPQQAARLAEWLDRLVPATA